LGLLASSAQADTIIDLTTAGAGNATPVNGALYQQVPNQSTGTGVINPFLRIQATGTESGYNTNLATNTTPFDDKAGTWTHDLHLSDLTVVTIGGVNYYQFLLDINQTAANPLLSLNNVQIFTRSTAIVTATENLSDLGTLRYNNDVGTGGNVTVELNYALNPGSGAGDMFMYVPTSAFAASPGVAGALSTDFVYFYSLFGNANGSNDGFEEWSLITNHPITGIPDGGATAGMLGMAMVGLGLMARRKNTSLA